MLWHHLITRELLTSCYDTVEYGWEVDSILYMNRRTRSRLHLAEVISRAAAPHGITLPTTDGALAFTLRFHQDTPTTTRGGTLTQTGDGRLGWVIGDGRTIESTGSHLTLIRSPEAARYTTAYRFPAITNN